MSQNYNSPNNGHYLLSNKFYTWQLLETGAYGVFGV